MEAASSQFKAVKEKENLTINFNFEIEPNIRFSPKITILGVNHSQFKTLDPNAINNLAFHLGLMEIPSYWKATCSPKIIINAGFLGKDQVNWWRYLILRGMGQFFYTNQIDFCKKDLFEIKVNSNQKFNPSDIKFSPRNILVPIGGGKDSPVTLEIVKNAGYQATLFTLHPGENPIQAAISIAKLAGDEFITAKREIDPTLLILNKQGYLNGHTPFSAYIAFLSTLVAVLFNCGKIAVSNERSSNEGNIRWLGKEINHQYSKSWEFEKNFRWYSKNFLAPEIEYFSLLRPLYDLQIAELFSAYPKYFSVFRSCNVGQKTNSWCGHCSKCLFVFASLYPFFDEEVMVRIFGKNLFKDPSLLSYAQELWGEKRFKPFECVGTRQESRAAFWLSLKKGAKKEDKLPFILEYFQKMIIPRETGWETKAEKILTSWSKTNNLSKDLAYSLRKNLKHHV